MLLTYDIEHTKGSNDVLLTYDIEHTKGSYDMLLTYDIEHTNGSYDMLLTYDIEHTKGSMTCYLPTILSMQSGHVQLDSNQGSTHDLWNSCLHGTIRMSYEKENISFISNITDIKSLKLKEGGNEHF